ncbi:MAG: Eco57I restriction-modification methylase domain-containing protein [Candidatus Sumerlaeota bacterium]|nr:Eco57I restriction-modification methylase domain-containing protein [Candidatus Sumerlaeota bacterium]
MTPPPIVVDLVERFERNAEAYRSGAYNEMQVRREFIDPFFKALGWDIDNEQGYAEAYKDVVHEDAIKVAGTANAPDYSFRIGGARKFFVEAKKPSVNIREDISPAYQLRRYAWSAKLPLSILTDFEEFAVYDCRVRPAPADKAATARVFWFKYTDYPRKWDTIAGIFSPDAIRKGSFDKFAESTARKRGTQEVDAAFLAEIESWRTALAQNIALRNAGLSHRDINFAVQATIDRIIFLRICEDRGIEDYGRLRALRNGGGVYARLLEFFDQADQRYNSGLFHFHAEKGRGEPDTLTPRLAIDDKALKEILGRLYYPDSPYEFSVLGGDILGQVYEQFLGKVIRLTAGHRAVVEEKPEVRKAGGVYYTPTYIVDYIVKNTVGRLLESFSAFSAPLREKSGSPAETRSPRRKPLSLKLRVLDPACGSGSFLLGAFECLLQWHLEQYTKDDPRKWATGRNPALFQNQRGEWRLTTAERKRILLNNIYGVDIDPQAVEVTKLSLLLKVLEGESSETLNRQLTLWHERALPDLDSNIKCGNSLIGPDFYQSQQVDMFDEEQAYRINAFDWEKEFSEILKNGGFDAVIGNPPYVRQESLRFFKEYLQQHYQSFAGTADLYVYFMERGVGLLRPGGRFGIIVSSSFLRASYAEALRRTLLEHSGVERIVDFGGLPVFAHAKDTYVCIPTLSRTSQPDRIEISIVRSLESQIVTQQIETTAHTIPATRLSPSSWSLKTDAEANLFMKVRKIGQPLGEYIGAKMFYGIKTGLNEAFVLPRDVQETIATNSPISAALMKPFLGGEDIRRYHANDRKEFLIVIPAGWTQEQMGGSRLGRGTPPEREAWKWLSDLHPGIASHLAGFEASCRKRQDQGQFWWELRPCDYYEYFESPKIIFPDICKGPRFYLDATGIYLANTAYCLGTDDRYLLGILNSRLFWFSISNISIPFGVRAGEFRYRLIYQYMEKVPIRPIDFSNPSDKARHDEIVALVERMLMLHKQLQAARTGHDQTLLQRQIDATSAQIDRLVYDLYGLTPEEIAIVEGGRG